jgi:hypothetical protein
MSQDKKITNNPSSPLMWDNKKTKVEDKDTTSDDDKESSVGSTLNPKNN